MASFEVMTLDMQMIDDGAYFIAEEGGVAVGCGGWTRRRGFVTTQRRPAREGGRRGIARPARRRHRVLDREIFYNLREARILIEQWWRHYNTKRPHSALDYRPPAPETIVPMDQRPVMH